MDILTIGEVLIDLTQTGKDARGIPQFAANPGGAPANLAVAASRLGAQTAFIGKVGADAFGRYLKEVLAENKVDVSGMAVDADHPTTMAVVSVDATGERDFSFYRSANADVMLCKEDISDEALKAAKIVHFGSVSLTADPSRTATLDAAARAKKLGATITYDPNYRANLWKNKEDAIVQMKAPLPLVDILKVSDEELKEANWGTLIFHPSPLPYGRGASSIKWAYKRGEPITAATWFWADSGYDTGDICEQEIVKIDYDAQPRVFYEREIIPAMIRTLGRCLDNIGKGIIRRIPQVEAYSTYDKRL